MVLGKLGYLEKMCIIISSNEIYESRFCFFLYLAVVLSKYFQIVIAKVIFTTDPQESISKVT